MDAGRGRRVGEEAKERTRRSGLCPTHLVRGEMRADEANRRAHVVEAGRDATFVPQASEPSVLGLHSRARRVREDALLREHLRTPSAEEEHPRWLSASLAQCIAVENGSLQRLHYG